MQAQAWVGSRAQVQPHRLLASLLQALAEVVKRLRAQADQAAAGQQQQQGGRLQGQR